MPTIFSIHGIPPVLTLAISLILAVLSIWKERLRSENVLFSMVCLCWATVAAALVCHNFLEGEEQILRSDRMFHFFFVYTPSVLMMFFHKIIGVRRKRLTICGFGLSFLISLTTQSEYYFSGLYTYSWGSIAKSGVAFHIFVIYCGFMLVYILTSLVKNLKHEKNRISRLKKQYILYSFLASAILMFGDCPSMVGVDFYPTGNFMFIPLIIMAYGVLKYRLMNIKSLFLLILFRTASWSLILVSNYLLFIVFRPHFREIDAIPQLVALGLWFLANYLYITKVQPVIDGVFYGSRRALERIESRFTENILSLKSVGNLIDEFETVVNKALSVRSRGVYMSVEGKNVFETADGAQFTLAPALGRWFLKTGDLVQRSMVETNPRHADVRAVLVGCFDAVNGEYAMPMIRNDELNALVFLSEKSNLQPMEAGEIDFVRKTTASLAVAVSNSILYQKISDLKDRLEKHTIDLTAEIEGRIKAEEERRDSEEKYGIIAENVSDVIWILDPETLKFPYVSPSVERFSGWTPEEMKANSLEDILTPDSLELAVHVMAAELAAEEREDVDPMRSRILELEHFHKDGSAFWAEVTTSATRDADGRLTGILGVSRNIMERKQLETRLRTARRMEAVGTLAGGVAHDLNNILSGIINYPELLLLDLPDDSPLRGPIRTIQKSGEKAAAVVHDLLTLARRGVSARETLDLNRVVSEYLKSPEFRRLRNLHPGVDVRTDLAAGSLNLRGSRIHLFKTVMNLISNAAEAMPSGGKVRISTRRGEGETFLDEEGRELEGDFVVLTVTDEGTGIAPEDQERIFEPFYTNKKMGRSGTGLGMSVVWGVVQDHDGSIEVRSEVGKGASFTIRFPESVEAVREESAAVSPADYAGKGESILVVDDVKEQREIATGILKRLGYAAEAVAGGEEAVERLKTGSVDLILLDMIMPPGMDGLATYKKILEIRPGQKAIIASGFSETEQVRDALEAGAGAYIKKPYLLEKLGAAVRAELDRRS